MTKLEWKDKLMDALKNAEDNTIIDIYNETYPDELIGYYGTACQFVCERYCDPNLEFEQLAKMYEDNVPFSGNFYCEDCYGITVNDDLTKLIDENSFETMTNEIMKDPFKHIRISTDDEFNKLISDYMNDTYIEEE